MPLACADCGSTRIIDDARTGDSICTNCGLVVPERLIDFEHEDKRTFNSDRSAAGGKEDNARTSRIDGISGSITSVKGDRNPNSKNTELINTLNSANNATVSYKEQKITDGRKGVGAYCDELNLQPNVKARAEEIWNSFESSRKKYSRSGDKSMYLAIIYKACKDKNCARTFKEIAQQTAGDHKLITKAYKRLQKNLQDGNSTSLLKKVRREEKSSAAETIPRIANKLNLEFSVTRDAKKLTKNATSLLEGKQPSTIGAACLLYQIRHSKSISDTIKDKDVATAAGIASSTLRSAYRTLEENSSKITLET